ncbi:MAG: S41 family peptidase [Saprospiraceae bacterium]|nr:S41 family peptidase [Saprospiraceae bacterium]
MKKLIIFSLFSALTFMMSSCEKAWMTTEPNTSKQAVFEQIWKFADEKYSFFDYKKIDWNALKTQYKSRVSESMSDEDFLKVCDEMLDNLKDGHVNIKTTFDRTRTWDWFLNAPPNFDKNIILRNYYKDKQQFIGGFEYMDFGDVAYVYYGSFSDDFSKANLDYIMEKAKGKKGFIIDIRDNGGGSKANVSAIAERFCREKTKIGQEWNKNGKAHNAFSKADAYLTPTAGITKFLDKPVVVLINQRSYSAANFFPFTMKALPNVTLMGDSSGGGGGIPTYTELSNGWTLRVSSSQTFDNQGFNIENGVPPTIKIDMTKADMDKGVDTILEAALKKIRG